MERVIINNVKYNNNYCEEGIKVGTEGHRHYKYNYLTNVIFRLDFPEIKLNQTPPWNFINDLKEQFPIHDKIQGQSLELQIKDFKHTTRSEDIVSWEFKDRRNEKRVVIDSNSLVFEHLKYRGFEDFYDNIKFIIDKVGSHYSLENINRLGLRYINQIDIKPPKKPLNWTGLIKKELTCLSDNFINDKNNISRSMQFLEMNGEDYRLRFQFGMYNSEYPNIISKKEFVLDYDCVTITSIGLGDVVNTTKNFHEIIYNWYEMSIDDKLRGMMSDEEE